MAAAPLRTPRDPMHQCKRERKEQDVHATAPARGTSGRSMRGGQADLFLIHGVPEGEPWLDIIFH